MAGFLGWVRFDGAEASVAAALACLRHHPSFRGEVLAGDGRRGVAVLYRPGDPPEVWRIPERGLLVAVLGAVIEHRNGRWHRFTAAELAEAYLERGLPAVSGLDGSYQLLIWDEPAGRVHFLNDRIGSRYMQHARCDDGVAFAPEAKALFRLLPLRPRLDFTGMVSFLNLGYPVGTHTLFEGVRLLAPAHRWTLDLRTGEVEQARTWVQRFEPDKRLSMRGAVDMLYNALLACVRAPLVNNLENVWIAMTGGYDSRLLLYLLHETRQTPKLAITWGATDQVPNSDPPVARALAAQCGVPHQFFCYQASDIPRHLASWLHTSELASDNLSCFACGRNILLRLCSERGIHLHIGDAVITSGGVPTKTSEAFLPVLKTPPGQVHPRLEQLSTPAGAQMAREVFWHTVLQVGNECPSSKPADLQDYIWTHIYNFRWLFSPGFYKEPMVTALRPMLLGPAYDALAQIPAQLRSYRAVYLKLLHRKLPSTLTVPRAEANCLLDLNHESRAEPALRLLLMRHLARDVLDTSVVSTVFNVETLSTFAMRFFEQIPKPERTRKKERGVWCQHFMYSLMSAPGAVAAVRVLHKIVKGGKRKENVNASADARILYRVALLVSFERVIMERSLGSLCGSDPNGIGGA